MEFWEANVRVLIDFVSSPAGAASMVLLLGAAMMAFVSEKMRFAALTFYFLILFVGPVPEVVDNSALNFRPLLQPFAFFRQNSRALMTLAFVVVVPIVAMLGRSLSERSLASILYLVLQTGWSFFQFVYGGPIIKILLGMILFLCCWFVITGRPIRTTQDWFESWRVIVWSLLSFIACHVILFALRSPGMMSGTRLQGMTSNPQFTAQDLALGCIILAALATDGAFRRAIRMPLWLVWLATGIAVSMLGLTGSRGGVLFAVVGLLVLFGANIGRAAIYAVPAAILVYFIGSTFFFVDEASGSSLQRLLNGEDTRTQLILNLFQRWMRNPILGEGGQMSGGYNECLYLYVAMRLGVFALIYVLWMMGQAIWSTFRGARLASGRRGMAHRLPMAIVVAIAVQNITEASLLSQFTISTSVFLLCCELGAVMHLLNQQPAEEEHEYGYAEGALPSPAF